MKKAIVSVCVCAECVWTEWALKDWQPWQNGSRYSHICMPLFVLQLLREKCVFVLKRLFHRCALSTTQMLTKENAHTFLMFFLFFLFFLACINILQSKSIYLNLACKTDYVQNIYLYLIRSKLWSISLNINKEVLPDNKMKYLFLFCFDVSKFHVKVIIVFIFQLITEAQCYYVS